MKWSDSLNFLFGAVYSKEKKLFQDGVRSFSLWLPTDFCVCGWVEVFIFQLASVCFVPHLFEHPQLGSQGWILLKNCCLFLETRSIHISSNSRLYGGVLQNADCSVCTLSGEEKKGFVAKWFTRSTVSETGISFTPPLHFRNFSRNWNHPH